MRLNATTMTMEEFSTYMIYDYAGNEVHYCQIADTDEGFALCTMNYINRRGKRVPLNSYDPTNPFDEGTVHTYQLHSFVIKDTKTGEIVAKV